MLALRPFKRFFEFSGRSGRAEFWQFHFLIWGVMVVASVIQYLIGDQIGIITGLIGLVCTVPQISVTVRRLHDTDSSGWWLVGAATAIVISAIVAMTYNGESEQNAFRLIIAPIGIAGCFLLAMCARGDEGENRFGWPDAGENEVEECYVEQSPDPAAVVTQTDSEDRFRQIERLGELRDRGLLTDDEFAAQKAAILARS